MSDKNQNISSPIDSRSSSKHDHQQLQSIDNNSSSFPNDTSSLSIDDYTIDDPTFIICSSSSSSRANWSPSSSNKEDSSSSSNAEVMSCSSSILQQQQQQQLSMVEFETNSIYSQDASSISSSFKSNAAIDNSTSMSPCFLLFQQENPQLINPNNTSINEPIIITEEERCRNLDKIFAEKLEHFNSWFPNPMSRYLLSTLPPTTSTEDNYMKPISSSYAHHQDIVQNTHPIINKIIARGKLPPRFNHQHTSRPNKRRSSSLTNNSNKRPQLTRSMSETSRPIYADDKAVAIRVPPMSSEARERLLSARVAESSVASDINVQNSSTSSSITSIDEDDALFD